MLNRIDYLKGCRIAATDGGIGHVKEAYFDDAAWVIRYLVVDTSSDDGAPGRDVLISPYAVVQPVGSGKLIDVSLTRQRVKDAPDVDTHRPVSRQHERDQLRYYAFPEYWEGGEFWGISALPLPPLPLPTAVETAEAAALREAEVPAEDFHLCSSAAVAGYDIQATDDSIGHVHDFIFDDESWAIRYLVVDTRNWWPGGAKVLLAKDWIERIDWADETVFVNLTREQVKKGPVYREGEPIQRDDEKRLHDAYDRQGYWD